MGTVGRATAFPFEHVGLIARRDPRSREGVHRKALAEAGADRGFLGGSKVKRRHQGLVAQRSPLDGLIARGALGFFDRHARTCPRMSGSFFCTCTQCMRAAMTLLALGFPAVWWLSVLRTLAPFACKLCS